MLKILHLIVTAVLALSLAGCITVPSASPMQVPSAPKSPPAEMLSPCDAPVRMPTDRPVEPSEGWAVILQNNGIFMDCAAKHAFLSGWFAGQSSANHGE